MAVAAQNADIAKTNAQNVMQANATNASNWKDVNSTAAQMYLNDVTAQESLAYKYDLFNEQTAYKAKTDFNGALARYESKLKERALNRELRIEGDTKDWIAHTAGDLVSNSEKYGLNDEQIKQLKRYSLRKDVATPDEMEDAAKVIRAIINQSKQTTPVTSATAPVTTQTGE